MILGILFFRNEPKEQVSMQTNRTSEEESFMQEFYNQKFIENIRKRLQSLLWLYAKGIVGYGSDKYTCLAHCKTGMCR